MSTTPPDRPEDPFGRGEESGDAQDAFGRGGDDGMTSGDPLGGASGNLGDTYGTPAGSGSQPAPERPQQGWDPPSQAQPQQQSYTPQPPVQGQGQTPGDATAALVLGIVGLLFCVIAAIPAIVLGNRAKKQIDANPGAFGGRGLAQAGVILGWVAVVLWTLFLLLVVVGLGLGGGSDESSSSTDGTFTVEPDFNVIFGLLPL